MPSASFLPPALGPAAVSRHPARRQTLLALAALGSMAPQARALSPQPTPGPLMKAGRYQAGQPVEGFLVSEKLDGVRARWDGQQLWTRSGRRIHAPAEFTVGWPSLALDGELWAGRGQFLRAVAAVREGAGSEAWAGLRLMVFDTPDPVRPFGGPDGRLALLQAALAAPRPPAPTGPTGLQALPQHPVSSTADLQSWLDEVVAAGGEGLMLHRTSNLYRSGRSNDLLKYKPFLDAEARVVQILPGKGQWQGLAGALLVQTTDGHRLRLGSGLSEAQRHEPPPVGSWVSFRYQGLHPGGMPRFASFVRVIPDIDL
ncbi:DNA ligase [Curvibacter lanceolatus]|uniref:DNA ligase n=1 Tax=Curvibacter lanceolatus TaxID=86182 RepID=UPI0030810DDB